MKLPKVVEDLTNSFEKLPGIGHRSAQRLAFYLLRVPQRDLESFAGSLTNLKKLTKICTVCHNLTDQDQCSVCGDPARDATQVCVVESFQDVLAIEKSGSYKGVYHVLHGSISPLNNIGPDELYIDTLVKRVKSGTVKEVILATNVLGKYNKLDKEDATEFPWEEILPIPIEPTNDVTVLKVKPLANKEEEIRKMYEKYKGEIDIEDIGYEEVENERND